jgi:very-short-patch-repair endonuclease
MAEAEPGVSQGQDPRPIAPLPGRERGWGEGGLRFRSTPEQTARARALRRQRTEAEDRLWHHVRAGRLGGYKFRTQVRVGGFYLDLVCPARRLVVEIDGGQHGEARQAQYDAERTRYLEANGYRVLRFWNNDVLGNTEGVLTAILSALSGDHPIPNPSPFKGEGQEKGKR